MMTSSLQAASELSKSATPLMTFCACSSIVFKASSCSRACFTTKSGNFATCFDFKVTARGVTISASFARILAATPMSFLQPSLESQPPLTITEPSPPPPEPFPPTPEPFPPAPEEAEVLPWIISVPVISSASSVSCASSVPLPLTMAL